jgi:branched-chain amino acid transport system substrate-binding protein
MSTRVRGIAVAAVFAALLLGNTATPSLAADTIKFAAAGPMTGPSGETGQRMRAGIELAAKEINESGGIAGKQVTIDFYDDEGKPEGAASVAQKIASDPDVFAVIGHINSSASMAALPIYKRAGLTEISGNSSSWKLTHLGYANFFRVIIDDFAQAPVVVDEAVQKGGRKRLAIIYENSDYGKGVFDAASKEAKKLGVEIVDAETYTAGVDRDFSAQLTKIKAANPDALIIGGQYGEGGPILSQAYRLGLTSDGKVLKLGFDGLRQDALIDLAGKEAAEGLLIFASFNSLSDAPLTTAFREKTMKLFGHPPTEQEAHNYDVVHVLKAAIESGATKETLPDVLRKTSIEGVSGHLQFDANGDPVGKKMFIFTVKDGKFVAYDN